MQSQSEQALEHRVTLHRHVRNGPAHRVVQRMRPFRAGNPRLAKNGAGKAQDGHQGSEASTAAPEGLRNMYERINACPLSLIAVAVGS